MRTYEGNDSKAAGLVRTERVGRCRVAGLGPDRLRAVRVSFSATGVFDDGITAAS